MEVCGKEIRIYGRLVRIAHLDGEGYQFLENPEAALASLRSSRVRADLFTFIQRLADTSPKYDYPMEWDNMAAIRISTYEDWIKVALNSKSRNMLRKAEKNGVTVREVLLDEALVRGISSIYNEAPIRQGRPFWHYGKDLESVHKMNQTFPDRSVFLGAFFENTLIGFAKLVTDEDRKQAGLMQIISMIGHRDKAPTNALIAQAVRSCAERAISYLWYANMSYGKKQRDTLADFKRHNGFSKVDLPRYYVPLTVAGRVALRLGLHHGVSNWFPEPVTDVYRRARRLWYAKRFPGQENA